MKKMHKYKTTNNTNTIIRIQKCKSAPPASPLLPPPPPQSLPPNPPDPICQNQHQLQDQRWQLGKTQIKSPRIQMDICHKGEGFTEFFKVKWVAFQAGLLWLCAMKWQTKYYSKTLPRPQQSLSSSSLVLFVQGNKTNTKAAAVLANQERSFFGTTPFFTRPCAWVTSFYVRKSFQKRRTRWTQPSFQYHF